MTEISAKPELDIFDRIFWRFVASLRITSNQRSNAIFISFAIVAFFAVLLASSPRIVLTNYTYDLFIALDGAMRASRGQWPHLDFYTPVGDLYYALLGFSAWLFGFGPKVVLWEQIIVLPFAFWATVLATRHRLPNSLRAVLIIMVSLLCISPSELDDSAGLSFLASYNRDGWVFIIPVLVAALIEPMDTKRRDWLVDALLLFVLILILFYFKVTFAVVAICTVAVAAALVPRNRHSCLLALFLSAVALGAISLSGPLTAAYIGDLHRASQAAPLGNEGFDSFRLLKLKADLKLEWFNLFAPLSFAVWHGRSAQTVEQRNSAGKTLLLCLVATFGSVGLAWQNHEHAMPSQIVPMLIVFAAIWHRQQSEEGKSSTTHPMPPGRAPMVLAAFVFLLIAGMGILNDGRAIILHSTKAIFNFGQPAATLSPYLKDLVVPIDTMPSVAQEVLAGKLDPAVYSEKSKGNWNNDIAVILDDGWRLFQANGPKNPRIVTLFSAPLMTVVTGTQPPRHMAAWMDDERTIGPRAPIVPERDFVDTNVVMVFKIYDHDMLLAMVHDYLEANFHVVGETPIWQMWVRNGE